MEKKLAHEFIARPISKESKLHLRLGVRTDNVKKQSRRQFRARDHRASFLLNYNKNPINKLTNKENYLLNRMVFSGFDAYQQMQVEAQRIIDARKK